MKKKQSFKTFKIKIQKLTDYKEIQGSYVFFSKTFNVVKEATLKKS